MSCKHLQKTIKASQISLIFVLLLLFQGTLNAQETDTITPVKGNPEELLRGVSLKEITRNGINFWENDFSGHFAGVDFGFNTFVNENYSGYDSPFMDNDIFHSNSAYINIIQQSFGLQKRSNFIGLVTGLGLHLQSYRLNNNTTIVKTESGIIQPQTLYFDSNQKSKLSIVSLTVPLLMEFQIPINHSENRMYLSAGLLGSLRINSHTKIKYRTDKKSKLKVEDDFSMHDLKYAIMVRAGYRWINVFATYDLVPLFEKEKGPELTPVTFGVTLFRF